MYSINLHKKNGISFHYITFIHINYLLVYTLSYQDVKLYTQCLGCFFFYPKEFLKFYKRFKYVKHTCIFVLHCICIIFVANFMSRIFFLFFSRVIVLKSWYLLFTSILFSISLVSKFKRMQKLKLNVSGEKKELIRCTCKSLCKLFGVKYM